MSQQEDRLQELQRQVAHLEAKFSSVKRRYTALRQKVDDIYEKPVTFALEQKIPFYSKDVDYSGKKIIILGATGSQNVGDDILGVILQRMLQQTMPGAEVIIRPQHLRSDIEMADAIIIGGGGLIYDATFENVTNYTSIILRAHDLAIPVYMAGMGVQYMITEKAKELYKDAFRFVRSISVRNDEDGDYLQKELGCTREQIIYARDLAFLAPEVLQIPEESSSNQKPRLVISLAHLLVDLQLDAAGFNKIAKGFKEQKQVYMTYVQENIGSLLETYEVQLVCQAQEDLKLYEMLQKKHPEITIVTFKGLEDAARLISVYQQADIAITGRYHGMIAGIVANVPTIGVSFGGHKIKKLIDDSFPSLQSQFYTMEQFVDKDIFARLLDHQYVHHLRRPTTKELNYCMELAKKNWQLVQLVAQECAKR